MTCLMVLKMYFYNQYNGWCKTETVVNDMTQICGQCFSNYIYMCIWEKH